MKKNLLILCLFISSFVHAQLSIEKESAKKVLTDKSYGWKLISTNEANFDTDCEPIYYLVFEDKGELQYYKQCRNENSRTLLGKTRYEIINGNYSTIIRIYKFHPAIEQFVCNNVKSSAIKPFVDFELLLPTSKYKLLTLRCNSTYQETRSIVNTFE
jgi:hypothetical protein